MTVNKENIIPQSLQPLQIENTSVIGKETNLSTDYQSVQKDKVLCRYKNIFSNSKTK